MISATIPPAHKNAKPNTENIALLARSALSSRRSIAFSLTSAASAEILTAPAARKAAKIIAIIRTLIAFVLSTGIMIRNIIISPSPCRMSPKTTLTGRKETVIILRSFSVCASIFRYTKKCTRRCLRVHGINSRRTYIWWDTALKTAAGLFCYKYRDPEWSDSLQ